jgi:hypothetical protein
MIFYYIIKYTWFWCKNMFICELNTFLTIYKDFNSSSSSWEVLKMQNNEHWKIPRSKHVHGKGKRGNKLLPLDSFILFLFCFGLELWTWNLGLVVDLVPCPSPSLDSCTHLLCFEFFLCVENELGLSILRTIFATSI